MSKYSNKNVGVNIFYEPKELTNKVKKSSFKYNLHTSDF